VVVIAVTPSDTWFVMAIRAFRSGRVNEPVNEPRRALKVVALGTSRRLGDRMRICELCDAFRARKQGCLMKPVFNCKPFRLLATKLEPALWEEIHKLLIQPQMAEDLIAAANKKHKEMTQNSEAKRIQEKIRSYEGQLEVLAGRLAQLPKTVSAIPVFKQMERIEASKSDEGKRLSAFQDATSLKDVPVPLKSYQSFLSGLADLAQDPKALAAKGKIIKALVHKVEITPEGFRAHFYVGRDYIEGELARRLAPRLLRLEPKYPNHGAENTIPHSLSQSRTRPKAGCREDGKGQDMDVPAFEIMSGGLNSLVYGSNTLTNPSSQGTRSSARRPSPHRTGLAHFGHPALPYYVQACWA